MSPPHPLDSRDGRYFARALRRRRAQGGPPFRTDDPETPGNQHWEINFGWIGDRDPAAGYPKQRESTLGIGSRQAINHDKTLNLLLMAGRSFQAVTVSNGQPSWIAYVGFQVLLGPK